MVADSGTVTSLLQIPPRRFLSFGSYPDSLAPMFCYCVLFGASLPEKKMN